MKTTWGGIIIAMLIASGCESVETSTSARAASEGRCSQVTLPWGSARGELGVTAGADEVAPRGPQAAAMGPRGQVVVLDSVNARLVELKGDTAVAIAAVPVDADDVAVGPDGAFAIMSSTRRRVWVLDADGSPAGHIDVPSTVRSITGVELGASHVVHVRTALQESIPLGSPAAPLALATSLAGTREGAFKIGDGRGLAVRVNKRRVELLATATRREDDGPAAERVELAVEADGANLVGLVDGVACLRLETVGQVGEALAVSRRALCVDIATGKVLLDHPLPAPGLQKPRQELALGGSPPRLLSLQPTDDGMRVETCEVRR